MNKRHFFTQWEEVRKAHPDKWVVFEAVEAHSDNNYRPFLIPPLHTKDKKDNLFNFVKHKER